MQVFITSGKEMVACNMILILGLGAKSNNLPATLPVTKCVVLDLPGDNNLGTM